jgi:hypothetical protein
MKSKYTAVLNSNATVINYGLLTFDDDGIVVGGADVVALSLGFRTYLYGHAKGKYINKSRAEVVSGNILGINNSELFDCLSELSFKDDNGQ